MVRWLGAFCIAAFAAGGGQAGAISADMTVSVTVLDQCLVHSLSRSATCSGGAVYAVGVARETVAPAQSDQLTASDEHVHTSANGADIYTISQGFAASGLRHDAASAPSGLPSVEQQQFGSAEAVRITYSF